MFKDLMVPFLNIYIILQHDQLCYLINLINLGNLVVAYMYIKLQMGMPQSFFFSERFVYPFFILMSFLTHMPKNYVFVCDIS